MSVMLFSPENTERRANRLTPVRNTSRMYSALLLKLEYTVVSCSRKLTNSSSSCRLLTSGLSYSSTRITTPFPVFS